MNTHGGYTKTRKQRWPPVNVVALRWWEEANHRGIFTTAAADGEKHHESERIGGIVSRRARPLQWNALTGSDARSRSYGTGWILKLPRQPVILAVDSPRIFSSVPHKALSKLASPRYACPPNGRAPDPSSSSYVSSLFSAFHSRVFHSNPLTRERRVRTRELERNRYSFLFNNPWIRKLLSWITMFRCARHEAS